MNHTGPDGKGPRTGRKLGKCKDKDDADPANLGTGMGKKRRSGGGSGKGQRLKSSKLFNNQTSTDNEDCNSNKE